MSGSSAAMSTRELFGGLITAVLPQNLQDLSMDPNRRQEVPDTQEVFRYNQSDAIIVVEVIARVEHTDNREAIRFIFNELADVNNATLRTIDDKPDIPQLTRLDHEPPPTILTGTQHIARGNRPSTSLDEVRIAMCLFRPHTHNDLLVTFNVSVPSDLWNQAKNDFKALVESLKVDPNLFASPSES